MNTENFKHYRVFTHPAEALHQSEPYPDALGNNASVIFVDTLPTEVQCLNQAQGLPKTTCVFIAPNQNDQGSKQYFDIAWYNSSQRIQRCGHGTLAAARYLHDKIKIDTPWVFQSAKEQLAVTVKDNRYSLQFNRPDLIASETSIFTGANRAAKTRTTDGYYIIDIGSESAVNHFTLTNDLIDSIKQRALIITSLADTPQYDIVFRYFAPQYGVFEDQATGSAGPYIWEFWQHHHAKKILNCYQASTCGGFFTLSTSAESIFVSGYVTEK